MHAVSRYFGHPWKKGDVVGCMINMEDKSMIFTLNGELLITSKGSELCFTDFETEDGENLGHHSMPLLMKCLCHSVSICIRNGKYIMNVSEHIDVFN